MSEPAFLNRFLPLLIVFFVGCGTGHYDELMRTRLEQLKREAPYAALQPPAEIPGTSVKIAIPKLLPRLITPDTDDPNGLKGKISLERVKYLPFDAQGVYVGYDAELQRAEGGGKVAVACQIAVLPKSDFNVLDAIRKKFPDQQPQPELVQVDAFGGDKKIEWSKVRIEAATLFDIAPPDPAAPLEFKSLPSIIEVWWHTGEHYLTIVTWRVPTEINDQDKLLDMAPLTAATLSEGPPPPAAEPPAEPAEQPVAEAPAA